MGKKRRLLFFVEKGTNVFFTNNQKHKHFRILRVLNQRFLFFYHLRHPYFLSKSQAKSLTQSVTAQANELHLSFCERL